MTCSPSETLYGFPLGTFHHRYERVEPGEELQANQVVLFQVQVLKPQSQKLLRPRGGPQPGSETGLGSGGSVWNIPTLHKRGLASVFCVCVSSEHE